MLMANVDKFRDDELMELSAESLGLDNDGAVEEDLVADGDYGHDHIPTDESEDDLEAMEQPYEKQADVESPEEDTPHDDGSTPPVEESEEEPVVEKTVPIARLNKEISKKQALEERLHQMEAQYEQQKQFNEAIEVQEVDVEFDKFAKMNELMLDGKPEEAHVLFNEMMKGVSKISAQNAIAESQQYSNQVSQVNITQATQAELLQQTAYELAQTYPILDDSTPDFNADVVQDVINLRDDLIQSGRFHPHVALEKATKLIMMDNNISAYAPPVAEAPVVAPAPVAKKVDIAAKVEKSNRQPSRVGGETASGGGQAKLDITTMTDTEFDALSADQLRRLRGDFI